MALRNALQNLLLLALSLVISLIAAEGVARLFLRPVDFLEPERIEDSHLGQVVKPGSGGHDDWGFRNTEVPETAEIVAIGDSQTYGVSATANDAWPSQLMRMTGDPVYNISLGAYGPVHYLHLYRDFATRLSPEIILVGLYLGNDLRDAERITYSNDHWSEFRKAGYSPLQTGFSQTAVANRKSRFLGGFRQWLSRHSVLYRVVTQTVLGARVREMENRFDTLLLETATQRQLFKLGYRNPALDVNSPTIIEGQRIAMAAIARISELTRQSGQSLFVVMIPTKELVYQEILQQYVDDMPPAVSEVFSNEAAIRGAFLDFFSTAGIAVIDPLPAMRAAVAAGEDIYPTADGHPNGRGYQVIAEHIHSTLGE